jgi:hypothetical protein
MEKITDFIVKHDKEFAIGAAVIAVVVLLIVI